MDDGHRTTVVEPTGKDWQNAGLTPEQGFVFTRVGQKASVADVINAAGLPEAAAVAALEALVRAGLLRARGPMFAAQAEAGEPPLEDALRAVLAEAERGDHYAVLGLSRSAMPSEVRAAFRERSKAFHPDRHFRSKAGEAGGAELRRALTRAFTAVKDADRVLSDAALRRKFDRENPTAGRAAAAAVDPAREARNAQRRLRRRLATNPVLKRSQTGRGLLAEALAAKEAGNIMAAGRHARLALALAPTDALIAERAAEILAEAAEAEHLRMARRVRGLLQHGEVEHAKHLMQDKLGEVLQGAPTRELNAMFKELLENGFASEAIRVARALETRGPLSQGMWSRLAEVYEQRGQFSLAAHALEQLPDDGALKKRIKALKRKA